MIDWTNDKIGELISLVQFASVLVAIVSVAYAYAKTRSLVALLVAALTAGLFLWTVHNTDWWQQRVEEESGSRPLGAVVVADTRPGPPPSGVQVMGGWRG